MDPINHPGELMYSAILVCLWMMLLTLFKLIGVVLPTLDNPILYLMEAYKIEDEIDDERIRYTTEAELEEEFYLTKIWHLLVSGSLFLQLLFMYGLFEKMIWKNAIQQIADFHEMTGILPVIPTEAFEIPYSEFYYISYLFLVLSIGGILVPVLDKIVEIVRVRADSVASEFVCYAFMGALLYVCLGRVQQCTHYCNSGEHEIQTLLTKKYEDDTPFFSIFF